MYRQFQMMGNQRGQNDTTFTKIFVGGLAWETQRETMRRYFEQFGEILEAVVIADKNTGRSKGYGFVTFKDPEAAIRACENPAPVIDGRRANCNLASLGATKSRLPSPLNGIGRFRPLPGVAAPPAHHGPSPPHIHQPTGPYFPYSAYGYTGYSQDTIYPLNYYGVYGSQQFSPYYNAGMFYNYYPFIGQNSQSQSYSVQYPELVQYPYLPQNYANTVILTRPSIPIPNSTAGV